MKGIVWVVLLLVALDPFLGGDSICSSCRADSALPGTASPQSVGRPVDRVVVMVFDQMRPDYVDRFDLPNFKRLRARSTDFVNAYVGHLPAVTIVSHPVLSFGVLPKELPWGDDLFHDTRGLLGTEGTYYDSHKLNLKQLRTLLDAAPKGRSLAAEIKRRLGGKVMAIGEKHYATMTFGTNEADAIITLEKKNKRCTPIGFNVPTYVGSNPRYSLECGEKFGTEHAFYSFDGSRLTPGNDRSHLGGDVWVADVALEVMAHEAWSGLLLTFGGIDKAGHLFGDIDLVKPHPFSSQYSLEALVKVADAQLGRILDDLKKRGILDRTAIVVTADHGAQSNRYYLGNTKSGASPLVKNEKSSEPPFWIKRLYDFGKVEATEQDTSIRVWTKDVSSDSDVDTLRDALAEISGVYAVYRKQRTNDDLFTYKQVYQLESQPRATPWMLKHDESLVDSMPAEGAPNYIALLEEGVGFDVLGSHGGSQEKVQRIPLFASFPPFSAIRQEGEMRLVDVRALVLSTLDR